MRSFTTDELQNFAQSVIHALGSSEEQAKIVAEHLATSNLAGHDSHGVIRLPQYRNHVNEGKIDPKAEPKILKETPTTLLLDGNKAWGQVVAQKALDLGIEKAKNNGLSAIAIKNCYHIGRVGVYPINAAKEGMICQVHCNGHGVARVAPWGGTEAKMANQPHFSGYPQSFRSNPCRHHNECCRRRKSTGVSKCRKGNSRRLDFGQGRSSFNQSH